MDIWVAASLRPVRIKLCTCLRCLVAYMSAFLEITLPGHRLYECTSLAFNVKCFLKRLSQLISPSAVRKSSTCSALPFMIFFIAVIFGV